MKKTLPILAAGAVVLGTSITNSYAMATQQPLNLNVVANTLTAMYAQKNTPVDYSQLASSVIGFYLCIDNEMKSGSVITPQNIIDCCIYSAYGNDDECISYAKDIINEHNAMLINDSLSKPIECNERCLNNMHATSAYYDAASDLWYPKECLDGYKEQEPKTASDGTVYYEKCEIILGCLPCDDACKKQLHATEIYCDEYNQVWQPVFCEGGYRTDGIPTTVVTAAGGSITYYDRCVSNNAQFCEYKVFDGTETRQAECSYLCRQYAIDNNCLQTNAESVENGACLCNATDEQIQQYITITVAQKTDTSPKSEEQTELAVAETDPKNPEIATPIETPDATPDETPDATPDATQLVMTEQETQQQVAQITGNDKNDKKVQRLTSEIECLKMGINSANVAEMNKCKKDPAAYAQGLENEKLCESIGYNKGTIDFHECKKDPAAFARNIEKETECRKIPGLNNIQIRECAKDPDAYKAKMAIDMRCQTLGATGALANLCKQNPDEYASKKSECERMNATGNKLIQCIKNIDGYKSQLANQQEKLAIENRCIGMGANGQNKNLCMEDPDAYASKKSECERMGATGNDLNRCIRNIEKYRSDYKIAQRAEELGVTERNAKKIMENEEEIKKLQESLGQV